MNLHAQMAGNYPGQVSNQPGTSLPTIQPQQNMIHNNSESSHVSLNMDPEFEKARRFIQDRIYEFLMRKQQTQITPKNVLEIVRRLEEGLFKRATSKEEYMSLDTLEHRLHMLIKGSTQNTQRYHQQNNPNPSSMGTRIPTPGVPHTNNNIVPSSADVMVSSSSSVNTGAFSGQMMPTPGFNNSNVSVISNVDSAMVSQPQQKQQIGGQNSRILHSLGSHMGSGMTGIRSTLNQKAYGFQNGSLNSNNNNLGLMGKSSQMVNNMGTSEGFLTDYGNAPKPVPQYFDQGQGQMVNDGTGQFYVPATSSTSMMNMNKVNLSNYQRSTSPLVVNQSTESQSEEMEFRNKLFKDNMIHNNSENARRFIQDRIYEFLMQRQQTQITPKNVLDIVRRLEEELFKRATSKEEYISLDTLEHRLHMLIKGSTQNTQRYQQQSNPNSNPSSMGTMIPTPGVPQTNNNIVPSSADVMVSSSSSVNTATFSSQLMPTPGFNNNNIVPPWEMEKLTSTLESLGLSPFDIG